VAEESSEPAESGKETDKDRQDGIWSVCCIAVDHGQLTGSAYVWVRFSCVVAIMSKAANTAMKNESLIVCEKHPDVGKHG